MAACTTIIAILLAPRWPGRPLRNPPILIRCVGRLGVMAAWWLLALPLAAQQAPSPRQRALTPTKVLEVPGPTGPPLASPADADVSPDGLAVLDGSTVYRFDHTGLLRDSIGRRGAGPGEIGEGVAIAVGPSGTVAVADVVNRRLSLWSPTGRMRATITLSGFPLLLRWSSRGLFVATLRDHMLHVSVANPDSTPVLNELLAIPLASDSATGDTPCELCTIDLTDQGDVLTADFVQYRVRLFDRRGVPRREWRLTRAQRTALSAEELAAREARIRRLSAAAGQPAPSQLARALPRHHPFIRSLGLDSDGRLWAVRGGPLSEAALADVFDDRGRVTAVVTLPPRARRVRVRGDSLVVVSSNAAGEPVVSLFVVGRGR